MKKFFKQFVITLLIFYLAFFCFASDSKAITYIHKDTEYHYLVIVKIVFDFADDLTSKETDYLLNEWYQGMDKIWNGSESAKSFGPSCLVDYQFELVKMPGDKICNDFADYHCIKVVKSEINSRGNIADAVIVRINSGKNSWGEWTTNTSGLNAAHEVGHMMGLSEEYFYQKDIDSVKLINNNYKESGPQSIMAQAWGQVAAFSEHVYKIMTQAGINQPIANNISSEKITPFNISFVSYENQTSNLNNYHYYKTASGQKIYTERIPINQLKGVLIKGRTDPAVYWVNEKGELRWLNNEKIAKKLFGQDWNKKIIWLGDSIIYSYPVGQPISE